MWILTKLGPTDMAAISISILATFFNAEPKSINRGENYYNSKHVELNILKDAVRGSVRGQNPTKKIVLSRLASASAAPGTLGQCKGAKKALGNVHRFPFYKRIGSLIDHDCGDNKNIQKAIFFDK